MSIQVIGLNPAVDVEWRVETINWNEKTVIENSRSWAGGKPPNVARWLRFLGYDSSLLMPLGGEPGQLIARDLKNWDVRLRRVPITQDTRTNVMVTPDSGHQLRFNPKGPKLSTEEWASVFAESEQGFRKHRLTVLSGSLPRSAPAGTHAKLIRAARRFEQPVILDCDGPALRLGVEAKPFLIKPNRFELSQWLGREVSKPAEVIAGARELSGAGSAWVFVSLDAGGGVLVHDAENFVAVAKAPRVKALNEVGAGDALLAQLSGQIANGQEPTEWLRWGIATGTAFVQAPAGTLPNQKSIDRLAKSVRVQIKKP